MKYLQPILAMLVAVVLAPGQSAWAQTKPAAAPPARQPLIGPPTAADVAYGPDEKNRLDFWQAASKHPTPVVIFFHGGGFVIGDKAEARFDPTVKACLDAGVSVVSINYPFLSPKVALPAILRDTARAVQFVRAQAGSWNLDRSRVAAFGESGGASLSLWLAFHDDLANPQSADPVARESTRLACAGAKSPQCSFDPLRWEALFGADTVAKLGGNYRSAANLGFASDAELRGPAGAPVRAEGDFVGQITSDDPPVFLDASGRSIALTTINQLLHHPRHALLLHQHCRDAGVADVAIIPAYDVAPGAGAPPDLRQFLLLHLGVAR